MKLTRVLAAACAVAMGPGGAWAGSLSFCDPPRALDLGQQDTLLQFAGLIKAELDRANRPVALVARSGLDLGLLGLRYSHAGLSLREGADTPWAVRQLYYACDEGRPRLFDQGMSAFVMGGDKASTGYVSVLLLPGDRATPLARAANDKRQALALLGGQYSANAYAFGLRYQNCNQWVVELLAQAWGALATDTPEPARAVAQQWLQGQHYQPTAIGLGFAPLTALAAALPWLHIDDHPADELAQARFQVSMPASIEAFVRERAPETERIEFCHAARRVVIRRGWQPIADGCVAEPTDTVIDLNDTGALPHQRLSAQGEFHGPQR